MKRQWTKAVLLAASLFVLTAPSLHANGGSQLTLGAKKIDGEIYVKASDVAKALGQAGAYNEAAGTYTISGKNPITEAVKSVSPSITAIIGKPKDSASGSPSIDDRYNLAHGTGIIIKEDGTIITNAHVVKDMSAIIVVTADGKQYDGSTLYMDEESDLAVVKVKASGLPAAKLASAAKVDVGETVVAIGTPLSFALRNSVTVGVISGVDRSINSTYRLLQTDAAINPGNSGGALINLKGEVIGVNSLKFAAVGVESLGFAIPADTVHYVLGHFEKFGKVKRPTLGFAVEESWAALVGLPTTEPLKISRVDKGSAAEKLGIKAGDTLYSINAQNIRSIVDLNECLKQFLPGDQVQAAMLSGGDVVMRKITLQ